MKDFDCRIKPTIVNETVCVFEFQVIRKVLFWKRVVYSGQCVVGRSDKRFLGEFCMPDEVHKFLQRIESLCEGCAKYIFEEYDAKNEKTEKVLE